MYLLFLGAGFLPTEICSWFPAQPNGGRGLIRAWRVRDRVSGRLGLWLSVPFTAVGSDSSLSVGKCSGPAGRYYRKRPEAYGWCKRFIESDTWPRRLF